MNDYELLENYDVKKLSAVKIGGTIKYLYLINNINGLKKVLKIIKENNYDYYIIGGCTKILFPDVFMRECLIKLNNSYIKETKTHVIVGVGQSLKKFSSYMIARGYLGFSGLISIPGDVGGAIVNNAGAFGDEISDYLDFVKVYENGKIKTLYKSDLEFSYRCSYFKRSSCIIFEAHFKKIKGNKEEIIKKAKENVNKRFKTQPHNILTLGSTFKNTPTTKIAQVLDELGLRGYEGNLVKISNVHANFLQNVANCPQKNFLNILVILRSVVYNNLKYLPELEIVVLRW
ncbi:MAG: FAD-binding protein [Erysipelotrichales bacterium]|nr:FAD-binding protein [Erysipelotrichales bacterium]